MRTYCFENKNEKHQRQEMREDTAEEKGRMKNVSFVSETTWISFKTKTPQTWCFDVQKGEYDLPMIGMKSSWRRRRGEKNFDVCRDVNVPFFIFPSKENELVGGEGKMKSVVTNIIFSTNDCLRAWVRSCACVFYVEILYHQSVLTSRSYHQSVEIITPTNWKRNSDCDT